MISAGYEAFNGYIFTASEAALYNRQCAFTSEAREAASLVDSDIMWECQNILCMPDRLRVAKSSKAMIRYRHGYAGYILN